jgi:hypothetical protein
MEKIIIDLEAKTDKAIEEIGNVSKSITELNKEVVKGNEQTDKSLKSVEKSAGSVSKRIKGFGLALKAAGFGLVISALKSMKEIFSENQRVVDVFSTAFEAFSIVINQVVTAFIDTYDAVAKSSENFNGLSKVLGGLITIGITPLKLGFFYIKLGIQQAQLAWEQSFFGGKDNEKIKELNIGIIETRNSILDTGKDAINAGKDIYNNFGDAIGEIGNIASIAGENLSKISVKSALEQAKVNVELKNSAEVAAAQQSRLVEQYDRQAEKLRQIRDDERNSLEVRKKANDDLLATLDEQEKAMLKQADLQVAAAQNEFNKNKNIENQIALIDALANREGVLAQVEGFRSEQQSNDLALSREAIELTNTKLESESKLSIERKRFNAEQIQDELLRLQALKEVDLLEAEQEALRLQAIVDNANAGTQAKVDAQIALNEFLEQSRQTNITRDTEIVDKEIELERRKTEAKFKALNDLEMIFGAESDLGRAALIGKQLLAAKELLIDLGVVKSKASKAIATANLEAASSGSAVSSGFAQTLKLGFPAAIPALIGYAASAVGIISSVLAATKKTRSVAGSMGGSGRGGSPSISSSQPSVSSVPPAFNVVGASSTNQLAEAIGGQSKEPVKAYVVSNDVTTAQSMDRNIVNSASI